MAKRKSAVDNAIEQLAKAIAEEHFEHNLEMYEDEAEFLADDGVTERAYMQGCDEHFYEHIHDTIAEDLVGLTGKEYDRLIKAKYKRIK